jgi:diaminopimelate decarboxylase
MSETRPYLNFNLDRVRENARRFHQTVQKFWPRNQYEVFYALKANPDIRVAKVLAQEDFGFEVMTNRQLRMASQVSSQIIVSGFHKQDEMIENAPGKVRYLVIEGLHEMSRVLRSEKSLDLVLRIKLGPDRKIGCDHSDIISIINAIKFRANVKIVGLHFHAGWNVTDETQIRSFLNTLLDAYQLLTERGVRPLFINLGGSFCEHSADASQLERRLQIYKHTLGDTDAIIHFEPGRYLVGDAGELVTQIMHVDEGRMRIYINTCAYGYKLTAGTPQAHLVEKRAGGSERKLWTLLGFWPSEGDQCVIEFEGRPVIGAQLVLENMGAYTWDMPMQFEYENGIEVIYSGTDRLEIS